jgi:hypothetical protein
VLCPVLVTCNSGARPPARQRLVVDVALTHRARFRRERPDLVHDGLEQHLAGFLDALEQETP